MRHAANRRAGKSIHVGIPDCYSCDAVAIRQQHMAAGGIRLSRVADQHDGLEAEAQSGIALNTRQITSDLRRHASCTKSFSVGRWASWRCNWHSSTIRRMRTGSRVRQTSIDVVRGSSFRSINGVVDPFNGFSSRRINAFTFGRHVGCQNEPNILTCFFSQNADRPPDGPQQPPRQRATSCSRYGDVCPCYFGADQLISGYSHIVHVLEHAAVVTVSAITISRYGSCNAPSDRDAWLCNKLHPRGGVAVGERVASATHQHPKTNNKFHNFNITIGVGVQSRTAELPVLVLNRISVRSV